MMVRGLITIVKQNINNLKRGNKKMKYHEFKEKQSKELNDFPMAFAFSDEQYKKALQKLNVKEEEAKEKLFSIPGGGMIRKSDSEAFNNMFKKHNSELQEASKNDDFLINAIEYELGNHEYCITYDPDDTIAVLHLNMDDDRVNRCFVIARANYMATVKY